MKQGGKRFKCSKSHGSWEMGGGQSCVPVRELLLRRLQEQGQEWLLGPADGPGQENGGSALV